MNRLSSTRLRLAPMPPILISSTSCDMSVVPVLVSASGLAALTSPSHSALFGRCFRAGLLGGPYPRLYDVLVTGAPAQVARQCPANVFLARVEVAVKQRLGRHHHAGRTEAALQAMFLLETLLQWVQLASGRQALNGLDLMPIGLDGEHRARLD